MRRPPNVARPAGIMRQPAAAILGPGHPLTRATEARECAVRQALGVAAIMVVSSIGVAERVAWAEAMAMSAAIVLSGLMTVAAITEQRVRQRALDLILEGRQSVRIAAVERECGRLRGPRTRRLIARALETMIRQASTTRAPVRGERPLFDAVVMRMVAPDLRAVIELLHDDAAGVRGIALAETLLSDGASALYGHDVQALRDQLQRVCELLRSQTSPGLRDA